jgi:hypothetical protein
MSNGLYCLMHELDHARYVTIGGLAATRAEPTVKRGGAIEASWLVRLPVADIGGLWRGLEEHAEHLAVIRMNATIRRILVKTNCKAISALCE